MADNPLRNASHKEAREACTAVTPQDKDVGAMGQSCLDNSVLRGTLEHEGNKGKILLVGFNL